MLDIYSKPIFCSKIALKGKTCSRLLKPQKVAPNAKSCSKVAEHNRDRPNGRRQRAKMKLLPSLFSCVYSRVKLFAFAMNSRRCNSIFVCFIYGLEEENSKSEVIFAVSRLSLTSCVTSLLYPVPPRILLARCVNVFV